MDINGQFKLVTEDDGQKYLVVTHSVMDLALKVKPKSQRNMDCISVSLIIKLYYMSELFWLILVEQCIRT